MFFPIPPVPASGDEQFSNVRLLLRMNGENNGTTFTDESNDARSLTRAGNTLPVTDTGVKKYGTASAKFPANSSGTAAHLRMTAPSIGTGTFTLELWFRFSSAAAANYILDTRNNSSYSSTSNVDANFLFYHAPLSGNVLRFHYYVSNVSTYLDSVATMSIDTWYHVAITRNSSNLVRLFLNGNLENSATIANNWTGIYWTMGAPNSVVNYNTHYIDDFRLTTGVCRYTASFTAPTAELPNSGATSAINHPQPIIIPSAQRALPSHTIYRLGL